MSTAINETPREPQLKQPPQLTTVRAQRRRNPWSRSPRSPG
ncbi:hypothetical protein [Corynebacterium aquatimens]|nr:hypothetical protein [Corynebacterium aquatimens]